MRTAKARRPARAWTWLRRSICRPQGALVLNPVRNAVEVAKDAGKAAGVITTVPFSHATPAGFVAHNNGRGNYRDIARSMLLESRCDVIMGAGHPWFDADGKLVAGADPEGKLVSPQKYDYVGGPDLWLELLAGKAGNDTDGDGKPDAWTLIQSREQFQTLGTGATPKRLLGVAETKSTLQEDRSGDVNAAPWVVPPCPDVPTLAEMTNAALNVLDNNPKGLFLMIEGGAVDWAAHGNRTGRVIEEVIDFNRAVDAVVAWVEKNGGWNDTLVLITADHETGYLCGPDAAAIVSPIVSNGAGNVPNMKYRYNSHTNSLVPLWAKGPGVSLLEAVATKTDPKRGRYVDNTDLGKTIIAVMEPTAP